MLTGDDTIVHIMEQCGLSLPADKPEAEDSLIELTEGGASLEEKRRPERVSGHQTKTRKRGSVVGKIFGVLGTLLLIGICTGGLLFGIFMKYVNTTLAPSLVVNADDYTMALSMV